MISSAFNSAIYVPLYNGLVFLVDVVPGHDMGIAVIALTILVRFLIYPLSRRAVRSQMAMKELAPKVEELNKKYKKNSPEHSKAVWELYREHGVHPFSSLGLILIQLPVLFGLYWVFLRGGLPVVDTSLLYSFVHPPASVNMEFLGLIDMGASHNIVLALLVGITQAIYSRLSMGPRAAAKSANVEASLSEDMARSFDLQARYMLPVIFAVASYFIVAAAPLYWATGNIFMIAQEYIAGRRF